MGYITQHPFLWRLDENKQSMNPETNRQTQGSGTHTVGNLYTLSILLSKHLLTCLQSINQTL